MTLNIMSSTNQTMEIKGAWAVLYKLGWVFIPIILGWSIWATQQIHVMDLRQVKLEEWKAIGPRFTPTDAQNLRLSIMSEFAAKHDVMRDKITQRLDEIMLSIQEVKIEVIKHTAQNAAQQTK